MAHRTGDLLKSVNPSNPAEVVGLHHKATADLARRAVEDAHAYAPVWGRTEPAQRAALVTKVAALIRERKFEFDAWLVFEAGKTWPEAEADVSEAIDFCEYYAREMLRLAHPEAVVQLPGERDEMRLPAAGRGRDDPAVEFPAGDPGGHDRGGAGGRQYGGDQAFERNARPSRRNLPKSCSKPDSRRAVSRCAPAAAAVIGDRLVRTPEDAFRFVHRIARRRPAHQRTGRQAAARARSGSSAWWRKWAARTRSWSIAIAISTARSTGVAHIGLRLSGAEVLRLLAGDCR